MAQSHSEQKGGHLLILSAESYTRFDDNGKWVSGSILKVDIPEGFDFEGRGKALLKRMESACRLFTDLAE
jgi:hypothetical protein